jgi:hypothetical protein
MPMELYKKIIDSIKLLGIKISNIHFGGMGEPLLDPLLIARLIYAKKQLKCTFTLTTNGKALNEGFINDFNKYFNEVYFSFHGNTPEEYEKLTGNNFEEMKKKYLDAKKILGNKLILVNHPEGKLRMLIEGKPPQIGDIHPFHNFADQFLTTRSAPFGIDASMNGQKYCEYQLFIIIGVDGSIGTCCIDWNRENDITTFSYPKCKRCIKLEHFQELFTKYNASEFETLLVRLNNKIQETPK